MRCCSFATKNYDVSPVHTAQYLKALQRCARSAVSKVPAVWAVLGIIPNHNSKTDPTWHISIRHISVNCVAVHSSWTVTVYLCSVLRSVWRTELKEPEITKSSSAIWSAAN